MDLAEEEFFLTILQTLFALDIQPAKDANGKDIIPPVEFHPDHRIR